MWAANTKRDWGKLLHDQKFQSGEIVMGGAI
jgi:hypothetical protein